MLDFGPWMRGSAVKGQERKIKAYNDPRLNIWKGDELN